MRCFTVPAVIPVLFLVACPKGTDSGAPGDSGRETGPVDSTGCDPSGSWAWTPLSASGDPTGDCAAEDTTCAADLVQIHHAFAPPWLGVDLRMAASFPVEATWELFLFPTDPTRSGHFFRVFQEEYTAWRTECDVTGCHVIEEDLPGSFRDTGPQGDRYTFCVALEDWGLEDLPPMGMGAAASYKHVEQQSQYTDLYPDGLTFTEDGARGLLEAGP